jgi:PTS system cellobiose-specific IIA component
MATDYEQTCMQIILHAGNGRAEAFAAIDAAKVGDFAAAAAALERADAELKLAHDSQTSLLTAEAKGARSQATMLLSHAMDILMAAMTERGLVEQIIELHRRVQETGHGQAADRDRR